MTLLCLCTYLYCFVVILLFYVFTSVGLLPPGESPIAVSNKYKIINYATEGTFE